MGVSELWEKKPEAVKPVQAPPTDPKAKAELILEFQTVFGLPKDNKRFNEWLTTNVGSQQIKKGMTDAS